MFCCFFFCIAFFFFFFNDTATTEIYTLSLHDALPILELRQQEIGYKYIKKTPVYFHGYHLGDQETRLINVEDKILTATIAVREVTEEMKAHLRAKMRHHGMDVGIIANFHGTKLGVHLVRREGNNE